MKLLLSLVLIGLLNLTNASNYINFIPSGNKQCSGKPSGLGYSFQLDTCFTLDYTFSHIISTADNGSLIWNQYQVTNETYEAICSTIPSQTTVLDLTSCSLPIVFDIDIDIEGPMYYSMSVTKESQTIPTNSYVISFMSGQCNSQNVFVVEYLTDGIVTGSTANTVTYYCNGQHKPISQVCISSNDCYKPTNDFAKCLETPQISNSSSESITNNYKSVYCS